MNPQIARAARVGAQATLVDVRQLSVNADLHRLGAESLHAAPSFEFEWTKADGLLICEVTSRLTVTDSDDKAEVFSASVTFAGVFVLPDDTDFDDGDYEAFASVNATFSLHPYAREVFQNLTARAGLPSYTLPPLRSPLDADKAAAAIERTKPAPAGGAPKSRRSTVQAKAPAKKAPAKKAPAKKAPAKKASAKKASARKKPPTKKRAGSPPSKRDTSPRR